MLAPGSLLRQDHGSSKVTELQDNVLRFSATVLWNTLKSDTRWHKHCKGLKPLGSSRHQKILWPGGGAVWLWRDTWDCLRNPLHIAVNDSSSMKISNGLEHLPGHHNFDMRKHSRLQSISRTLRFRPKEHLSKTLIQPICLAQKQLTSFHIIQLRCFAPLWSFLQGGHRALHRDLGCGESLYPTALIHDISPNCSEDCTHLQDQVQFTCWLEGFMHPGHCDNHPETKSNHNQNHWIMTY